MRILHKGKIYTLSELKKILTKSEWNKFIKKYNSFYDALTYYVENDDKFKGVSI